MRTEMQTYLTVSNVTMSKNRAKRKQRQEHETALQKKSALFGVTINNHEGKERAEDIASCS